MTPPVSQEGYPPSSPSTSTTSPTHQITRHDRQSISGSLALTNATEPELGLNDALLESDVTELSLPGEDVINSFVALLVGVAALSGLLFGYDTSAISGALVNLGDDLGPLSDWNKEEITAATTLGALLGGLGSGTLSDWTGRKVVIGVASALFVVGAIQQAWCNAVWTMCIGRFIVGLGVGQASCIVPLYIGELAPAKLRGRLVTINCVMITLGQVVAYVIGMVFQYRPGGWRWMLGLGAVPGIVQLASLAILPESPRMLLLQSRKAEARVILGKIYPQATEDQVDAKLASLSAAVRQSVMIAQTTSWQERLRSLLVEGPNRRALIIGAGLQAWQQLTGINTALYYSATLFAALGFRNAIGVGCVVALANFVFTLVALRLVDSLGRRKTMLYTTPFMGLGLVLMAAFFRSLTSSTGGVLVDETEHPTSTSTLIVLSMMVYVSAYATGMGNIPWQQGELFRLDVRGLGSSICTATNWSCNLVVAATFLSLMDVATPSGAFLIYAVMSGLAWVFCYCLYPETSGLSLEEVYELFRDDFGVQKVRAMRA